MHDDEVEMESDAERTGNPLSSRGWFLTMHTHVTVTHVQSSSIPHFLQGSPVWIHICPSIVILVLGESLPSIKLCHYWPCRYPFHSTFTPALYVHKSALIKWTNCWESSIWGLYTCTYKASHLTAFCAWDSSPHLLGHPSTADETWYCQKCILCDGWLCILSRPAYMVYWLFLHAQA